MDFETLEIIILEGFCIYIKKQENSFNLIVRNVRKCWLNHVLILHMIIKYLKKSHKHTYLYLLVKLYSTY